MPQQHDLSLYAPHIDLWFLATEYAEGVLEECGYTVQAPSHQGKIITERGHHINECGVHCSVPGQCYFSRHPLHLLDLSLSVVPLVNNPFLWSGSRLKQTGYEALWGWGGGRRGIAVHYVESWNGMQSII